MTVLDLAAISFMNIIVGVIIYDKLPYFDAEASKVVIKRWESFNLRYEEALIREFY